MLAAGCPVIGREILATEFPNDWLDQTMSYQLIQTTSFAMHPRLVNYITEALVWMYCSCLLVMMSSPMTSSSIVHLDVPAGSLLMFQLVHLPLLALAADVSEMPKDKIFDARSIVSLTGEPVILSGSKSQMKMHYRLLCDIMAKSISVKAGSFNAITVEKFSLLTAVLCDVRMNWGSFLFGIFKKMVSPGTKKAKGFAIQISLLLDSVPNLELGESSEFPSSKILTDKTIQRYIAIIDKSGEQELADAPKVKKAPKTKVASKKRPADFPLDVPVLKNKRTSKKKSPLEIVFIAQEAIPILSVPVSPVVAPMVEDQQAEFRNKQPAVEVPAKETRCSDDVDFIIQQVIEETREVDASADRNQPAATEERHWFDLPYEDLNEKWAAERPVVTASDTDEEVANMDVATAGEDQQVISNEVHRHRQYDDTLPSVSEFFKLMRKRWTDVCLEFVYYSISDFLSSIALDRTALSSVQRSFAQTVVPSVQFSLDQRPSSPTTADSSSSLHFDTTDVDATVSYLPPGSLAFSAALADFQAILSEQINESQSGISSRLHKIEQGFRDSLHEQAAVIKKLFQEACQEGRSMDDVQTLRFNEFRKNILAQNASIFVGLADVRHQGSPFPPAFRIPKQAQENQNILHAQLSELVDYIRRGSADKRGKVAAEDSNSLRMFKLVPVLKELQRLRKELKWLRDILYRQCWMLIVTEKLLRDKQQLSVIEKEEEERRGC
ncbi:hypothetical protein F511_38038 [Dorcoceras hygrometricum]|uniref:Uncharacterized protein n=1 Tax=Dorcoceras hygrometricum TaxID=472368 RepID=A0A2Z7AYC1_9LAMI|nr:hypothetical protein F511_38038 [Dorcoceras hygrometricum]